jgi:hypothetical protein
VPIIIKCISAASDKDISVFSPALRCIGNAVSSSDDVLIERFLFHGLTSLIKDFLCSPSATQLKEVIWILTNITAGPPVQID